MALTVPGKRRLTYGELSQFVGDIDKSLELAKIEAGAPVAAIFSRGAEAWVAFLGVSCRFACVPMPSWTPERRILQLCEKVGVRAVVVEKRTVSTSLDFIPEEIAILSLDVDLGEVRVIRSSDRKISKEIIVKDTALLVGTSGSTGESKLVPLSQSNILSAANAIAEFFSLDDTASCANLMPYFHVHGLISAGVSTLVSGGELIALDGVASDQVIASGTLERASWITGVPALYHGLLSELEKAPDVSVAARFVRVASAPLDPALRKRLEHRFGCRVIESYGLSETASLIASQDPRPANCAGSGVGVPVGAEIQIWDNARNKCPPSVSGEIVIRGPSVCLRYFDGSATTLSGTWLGTGDIGYFSDDGCLHISGRTKHMINRAGETISPKEIEHVCLEVMECSRSIAWGEPNPKLGEQPVVAIETGSRAPLAPPVEIRYRSALLERLPISHMPVAIFSVRELPCNDVGKLDLRRVKELFRTARAGDIRSKVGKDQLGEIEKKLIESHPDSSQSPIDTTSNYHLALGGTDELRVWARGIRETFGIQRFGLADMYRAETLRSLAYLIDAMQKSTNADTLLSSDPTR